MKTRIVHDASRDRQYVVEEFQEPLNQWVFRRSFWTKEEATDVAIEMALPPVVLHEFGA
jgi:hypothetical protein